MEEEVKKTDEIKPDVPAENAAVEGAVAEPQPPKGRAAALARYKERFPDSGDDVDDDTLYDDALGGITESEGKYKELADSNSRLADMAAKDQKLMAVLSLISGDKKVSLPYAMARIYGKDWMSLEGEALDDFENGYQEYLAEIASSKEALDASSKNIEEYQGRLDEFGKSNGLSSDDLDKLGSVIEKDAIDILHGIISPEFIDFKWKGMNYDKDVQEAADAGVVEGKGANITAKMKELKDVPAAGGGAQAFPTKNTGTGNPKHKKSIWEDIKEVE